MKTAEDFMNEYLGGNMNTSTLTPFAIQEMMNGFALEAIKADRINVAGRAKLTHKEADEDFDFVYTITNRKVIVSKSSILNAPIYLK